MATQTPGEHRSDEHAGKMVLWVIVACSALTVISILAAVAYYMAWIS